MNGKNHPMDRVYKVLMHSPELTEADLKNLPISPLRLNSENVVGELLSIFEKLGDAQQQKVLSFARKCLKEESSSIA